MFQPSIALSTPPPDPEPPGFRGAHLVLAAERLTAPGIQSVLRGSKLALRIPKFFTRSDADVLSKRLLGSSDWDTYAAQGAPDVGRLGRALFDCHGAKECETYFRTADENRRRIQLRLHPFVNPADLVQVEADHCWPHGCYRLVIGGRKCFLGLPRAFFNGGEARPHTDRADWDWPSAETLRMKAQLAFNCYLSMTTRGGDLELWSYRPNRDEYERMRDGYGLHRELLAPPDVVIRPQPGELILFDASRVHAVTPSCGEGVRVTISGFLGYEGDDLPLRSFS
jgi:hypothetical protein